MKLGKYFSLAELTRSQTALRRGIDNKPNKEQIQNLEDLVFHVLDPIRTHFRLPVNVNSGFRCLELNEAVGSKSTSQHTQGKAADIEIPTKDNLELAKWISENMDFDQLILEFHTVGEPRSGWVHVSWEGKGKNRRQVLTINRNGVKVGLPE
jgi:uncharacterized protein YcbK (DUF882 family)